MGENALLRIFCLNMNHTDGYRWHACQQVWRNSGTQTFEEIKYLGHERFLPTECILNDRLTDHFYKILKSISRKDINIDQKKKIISNLDILNHKIKLLKIFMDMKENIQILEIEYSTLKILQIKEIKKRWYKKKEMNILKEDLKILMMTT